MATLTREQQVKRLARAGDIVAEELGIAVASMDVDGTALAEDQLQAMRNAILVWHLLKAETLGDVS